MRVLLRLAKYSLERRALFIVTAVVMASSVVPQVAIPRLTGNAIDKVLASAHGELALIVGQIVLAGVIRAVLGYLALYMAERVGRETEYRLRNDFFDKLQSCKGRSNNGPARRGERPVVVSTLSDSVRLSVKGKCPLCRLPC